MLLLLFINLSSHKQNDRQSKYNFLFLFFLYQKWLKSLLLRNEFVKFRWLTNIVNKNIIFFLFQNFAIFLCLVFFFVCFFNHWKIHSGWKNFKYSTYFFIALKTFVTNSDTFFDWIIVQVMFLFFKQNRKI